ncbi:hypothetical protein F6X00_24880 [Vibrio vulnificus]|uniref:hypothetical protein n=1 Tax=Vibrio vulnificus TaxID=672 RepID=UPI0015F7C664|nr:hypothetical protein [Vibrio vulnificus]EJO9866794.1 hypothetical protein [Vibrio vulnificus]MBN8146083.1 hypothetical protein [Vibrio vulnificus]QMV39578.1 hypothetical protein F6X00_24880 [Vibrio vulnificus]HAS6109555.1 hypothetical protein [Vibrio vulnificus]HAS6161635.1 hypothetical protein [Vibrio vulnificus]
MRDVIETELRIRHDALANMLCVREYEVLKAIEFADISQTDRCEHFTHELRAGQLYYRVSEGGVRTIAFGLGARCARRKLKGVLGLFSEKRRAHANTAFLK